MCTCVYVVVFTISGSVCVVVFNYRCRGRTTLLKKLAKSWSWLVEWQIQNCTQIPLKYWTSTMPSRQLDCQWMSLVGTRMGRLLVSLPKLASYLKVGAQFGFLLISGDRFFVCGGHNGEKLLNTCEVLSLKGQKWEALQQPLQKPVFKATAVGHGKHLWLIGGSNGDVSLNSTLRYDTAMHKWKGMSPMAAKRQEAAAAVKTSQGGSDYSIIICGGRGQDTPLSSCESYDPKSDQWTTFPKLQEARASFGLLEVGDILYAIGGVLGV